MHISLTPRLEAFVKSRVESGLYNNVSEVMREALRRRMEEENEPEFSEEYRAWVDGKLAEAEADIEAGHVGPLNYSEFIAEFEDEEPQAKAA